MLPGYTTIVGTSGRVLASSRSSAVAALARSRRVKACGTGRIRSRGPVPSPTSNDPDSDHVQRRQVAGKSELPCPAQRLLLDCDAEVVQCVQEEQGSVGRECLAKLPHALSHR